MQVERFTKQELLQGEKFLEKEAAVLDGDLEYGLRSFGKGFTVLEGSILKEEQARAPAFPLFPGLLWRGCWWCQLCGREHWGVESSDAIAYNLWSICALQFRCGILFDDVLLDVTMMRARLQGLLVPLHTCSSSAACECVSLMEGC